MARKDDPRLDLLLGRVALERGLIDGGQLREALSERSLSVARGRKVPRPLGAILASKKHLSDAQVAELTRELEGRIRVEEEGRRKDAFFGQILIDADLVAPGHVEECLFDQAERWKEGESPLPRLGDLLVLKGYATKDDVAQALALQRSMIQVCAACLRECSLADDVDRCPVCGGAFKPRMDSGIIPAPVPPPAPAAPADLASLGRYKLRATLEKTPTAVVYDARDLELDRPVELRVLRRPEDLERARAVASLKHPNLAPVFEEGSVDGRPFVASERVDGRSLAELRKAGALKTRQEVRALRDVALALDHLHQRGLAHRDLHPGSVRIDGQGRPRIVDLCGASESPEHMSPERARGDRSLGPAADVWSLGVLLYETLAGAPPFRGETREATLAKVMCEPPAPPSTSRAVNRPLETLCLRALEKKPARRPASAKDFAEALTAWLKGEAEAAPPHAKKRDVRRWIAIAAGALLGLAGLIAGLALATGESRTDRVLRKAGEYLAAGQPDAALQLYERVLEREPANERARSGREAARARVELEDVKSELDRARGGRIAEK